MQKGSPGFWDFFGPIVLALAPLLLFAFRNTRAWRAALLVWFLAGLGVFFASGLPRFLLPLFPTALACVAAGFEVSLREGWRIVIRTAAALLAMMACAGALGFVLYVRAPLRVAIGMEPEKQYLEERAPDFEIAETVNRLLNGTRKPLQDPGFFSAPLLFERSVHKWRPGHELRSRPGAPANAASLEKLSG